MKTSSGHFLFTLLLTFVISSFSWAHSEKSHSHGTGTVSIAFDGLKGEIEFSAPSDSTQGFEHKAQSRADLKKEKESLDRLRDQMEKMVVFPAELKCKFTAVLAETDHDSGHSETKSRHSIQCQKSPLGSTVDLRFTEVFPKLKKVNVQILIDSLQKSAAVPVKGLRVDLK